MTTPKVRLEASVLDRLLDPADPALRARVLVDVLGHSPDSSDVAEARGRIADQAWVRATLAAHNGDGTWGRGFYHKYDGTSWALLHLSEVGAPMDHPAIQAGAARLLETAQPVGGLRGPRGELRGARGEPFRDLEDGVYWKYPLVCLTAHMALVLIRAGFHDHPVTRSALDLCRHPFDPAQGFGCSVMVDSLMPACVMTVPKALKAFLALPAEHRTAEDQALIDGMVSLLKRFGLYRYVPVANGEWRAWAGEASAEERRLEKPRWIAAGRLAPRKEKEGWQRFSFPHSYNSDLLEVLLLLGRAGAEPDRGIEEGLELLVSRRGGDGMWKMVGGLNGKMHADLDAKGQPSPWITYRAVLALKRFGQLEVHSVPGEPNGD